MLGARRLHGRGQRCGHSSDPGSGSVVRERRRPPGPRLRRQLRRPRPPGAAGRSGGARRRSAGGHPYSGRGAAGRLPGPRGARRPVAAPGVGASHPGPIRLIPDPARPPKKMLTVITSGTALWRFVKGAYSFFPSSPDGLSDEHEDLIAAFFDNLRDWMDISGDLDSYSDELNARRSLDGNIEELAKAGFVVGARERFLLLTGGVNEAPSSWRAFDI